MHLAAMPTQLIPISRMQVRTTRPHLYFKLACKQHALLELQGTTATTCGAVIGSIANAIVNPRASRTLLDTALTALLVALLPEVEPPAVAYKCVRCSVPAPTSKRLVEAAYVQWDRIKLASFTCRHFSIDLTSIPSLNTRDDVEKCSQALNCQHR